MPAPTSNDELLDLVRRSGVLEEKRLEAHLQKLHESSDLPAEPAKLAAAFVRDGLLTNFQSEQLMQGKWRRFAIGKDENLHFLVMEYVEGPSLQDVVRRRGPISVERACHYISQAAQALEHASKAGLVHRDVKPGNILVDRSGVVKILDMGLARFF